MANDFYITNAVAQAFVTAFGVAADAGTGAVINIYEDDGAVPADADASLGSAVLLAQLACSATLLASVSDDTPGALGTFDTISDDSSANASGTATFFRILTQDGGTVIAQGTVGTASADMIMNTVAFSSGSTVSINSATVLMPEGN